MSFAAELKAFCEKAKIDTKTVVRNAVIEMQSSCIKLSAVDTGQFRANWVCSVGKLNKITVTTTDELGELTIQKAMASLEDWEAGLPIYISNSLPQAKTLEFGLYGKPPGSANGPKTIGGHSRQSPGGMVRLTVQNFRLFVHNAVQEVK